VRWQHPDLGPMSAERILTLAEQGGLMLALTLRVLARALQQQQAWRAAGCDLMLSVNLAASCLANPQFPQILQQILTTWDGDARRLILEVAESALSTDAKDAAPTLERLAGLGCQLALDDFGTGAFSLSSLRRLPVDELKIDPCFVAAMTRDDDAAAIVRSAISLGRSLELRVVAEGVPDEPTLAELLRLGCDQAQGQFVGPPLTAEAFAEWMRPEATATERQPVPA
jgi:diguanylate cyclase